MQRLPSHDLLRPPVLFFKTCDRAAMAPRLHAFGCNVLAVDRGADDFMADLRHIAIDVDRNDFACQLVPASFDLSPPSRLSSTSKGLSASSATSGASWHLLVGVITTPKVDCLPARAKFFLTGKMRTMDAFGEPTHSSPPSLDMRLGHILNCLTLCPSGTFSAGRYDLLQIADGNAHSSLSDHIFAGSDL